ncbi:MAG: hypothetical protein LBS25_01965 [Candidatus Symbiothrix sp.]|jgi:hypothetical protein|nr:hypothetical protein [Candidatus Symbiothrix sp.]
MKNRIISLCAGLCIVGLLQAQTTTLNQTSGTISISQSQYVNNMDRYWYIDAGSNSEFLQMEIDINTELGYDLLSVYSVDDNWEIISTDLFISGSQSIHIAPSGHNGKAVIHFTSDGSVNGMSGYGGFNIFFYCTQHVMSDSYVSGNAYIDGSLRVGTYPNSQNLQVTGNSYFTGKVGIGATTSTANLEVYGNNANFVVRGSTTRLEIGVPSCNGYYAPTAVPGDVVLRPLGMVNGRFGLIFNLPTITGDGNSTIKFSDSKNGDLLILRNNKTAYLNGKLGIGKSNPDVELDVNGSVSIPYGQSYRIGSINDSGNRLRLHHNGASGHAYIDFAPDLYFRSNAVGNTMTFLQNGNVGIGTTTPQALFDIGSATANEMKSILARLSEGGTSWLGVKAYDSQPTYDKMFAIEHKFYNVVNNSINFHRGGGTSDGSITFDVHGGRRIAKFCYRGLDVFGTVAAKHVIITETEWADFVFHDNYRLRPLSEVSNFITEHKHLPEIPSAQEVKASEGVDLGEMQTKLLQKIEELTLYLIEQDNKIQTLEAKIQELENK